MSFAFTGFLLGGLAIAIPIILHLLKHKPTDTTYFPALDFLYKTIAKKQKRNNIRKWLILLFRCLAIIALVLAFAWPYLSNFAKNADSSIVLLWDNSFSMQATPYAKELKDEAIKIINNANDKNPVLIGMVTKDIIWNDKFSSNPKELLNWFNKSINSDNSSLFERAIREANIRIESMAVKSKTIIIISDNQALPWKNVLLKNKLSSNTKIKYIIPKKQGFENVTITNVELLKPFIKEKQELDLKIVIENYTNKTYKSNLYLKYQDKDILKSVVINPGLNDTIYTLKIEKKESFPVHIKLNIDDQLIHDNQYNFAVIPNTLPKIYFTNLKTNKLSYIKEVFSPSNQKKYLELADYTDKTTLNDLKQSACLIIDKPFLSSSKKGTLLDQYLINGGNVIMIWNDSPETKKILMKYGIISSPLKSQKPQFFEFIDFNHPIIKIFNEIKIGSLFDIMFFSPPKLTIPKNSKTIARFSNGFPAIVEIPIKQGKLFVIATKLERKNTNWQSNASFLPFWRELLLYCNKKVSAKSTFKIEEKETFFTGVNKIINLDTQQEIKVNNEKFKPNKRGNFLITIEGKETLISTNLPLQESKSVLLSKNIKPEHLSGINKNIENNSSFNSVKEQGKSYWWIFLCLGLIFTFIELFLANRTGL